VPERFLVTGALGCIGAWSAKTLLADGADVVSFDLGDDRRRLELIMDAGEIGRISFVRGDVADLAAVERALDEHEITHVIHLAALLVPVAQADPPRGALVNVLGTANVFEAVRRRRDRVRGIAYASSIAAYDASDGPRVSEDVLGRPRTHYGVFKQTNEGTARVYWHDGAVPSVGFRPYIVYGPGRDAGLTAAPTLAMAAAACGDAYEIPFGGRAQYHYAPEVARAFVDGARTAAGGATVRNLGGPAVDMADVVAAIEEAAPDAAGRITYAADPLPFPPEFEAKAPLTTPLREGVHETIDLFRLRSSLSAKRTSGGGSGGTGRFPR
jgi:UDP-glucuronate 4-epimerase